MGVVLMKNVYFSPKTVTSHPLRPQRTLLTGLGVEPLEGNPYHPTPLLLPLSILPSSVWAPKPGKGVCPEVAGRSWPSAPAYYSMETPGSWGARGG